MIEIEFCGRLEYPKLGFRSEAKNLIDKKRMDK